jgi:4-hydroxy-tetrahydrodipicolinate reductase
MTEKPIRILLAGATGRTGRELVNEISASADLKLVAAVSRSSAGQDIGKVIGRAH